MWRVLIILCCMYFRISLFVHKKMFIHTADMAIIFTCRNVRFLAVGEALA